VKVGDLVNWLDPWKVKRLGLVRRVLGTDSNCPWRKQDHFYNILINGKIEICHRNNLELVIERL
jgi:hypothetical protein